MENQPIPDNAKQESQQTTSTQVDMMLAIIGGLSLTFIRGIQYIYDTQVGYYLYGLRLYDPNFIPRDWLVGTTFQHHIAFGYFLYFLQKVGSLYVMSIIAQVAFMTAFSYGLLIISRRFLRYPVPVFFGVILYMGFVRPVEFGLGGQTFLMGYLQPSEIASALMILGLAFLFERRYLASGIVLGFAGLFHAQFLASFGAPILVTFFAMGVWRNRQALISFLVPLALLWGILVAYVGYCLLHSAPPTMDTLWILINLRAPVDNVIANWDLKINLLWVLWIGLGAMAISMLPKEAKFRDLRICFAVVILTCLVSIAQAALFKVASITIMEFWRVAPLAMLLSLLVVLDKSIDIAVTPEKGTKGNAVFLASAFVAGMVLANKSFAQSSIRALIWLIAVPLAFLMGTLVSYVSKGLVERSKAILTSFLIIIVSMMGIYSYRGLTIYSHNYLLHPASASLGEMENWCRANTPNDAIFVIPPELEYMRIRARRAIVVDWKTPPVFPSDMEEWYRRICAISGISTPRPTYDLIKEGYRHLDTKRAEMLRQRYGATFVVVKSKEHVGDLKGLMERFRNQDYQVFEIPPLNSDKYGTKR